MIASLVALRKESVDRNDTVQIVVVIMYAVALRKESVDRNHLFASSGVDFAVALRKESVDRNGMEINGVSYDVCRSPQGERG